MIRAVFDTNVLVSALLQEKGLPALSLSLILQRNARLCVSDEVWREYTEVLAREKFHSIKKPASALLSRLKQNAVYIKLKTRLDVNLPDPDDIIFLECAVAAGADYLVTGNTKHFPARFFRDTKIVTPREFLISAASAVLL